jgi:hypothetical protein
VSCSFSKEALALHVESDLSQPYAEITSSHLATCEECRRFFEDLRTRQFLLKSLRRDVVDSSDCAGMRRDVMTRINDSQASSGWMVRVERALVLGFRLHAYVLASVALLGVLSVSVVAQMRHVTGEPSQPIAVFEGKDTLIRPEGYRDWLLLGLAHNAYIDPSGWAFVDFKRFDGTLTATASALPESSGCRTCHPHT